MSLLWRAPLTIVLWLSLITWPALPDVGLDPSWQQVLVDAWLERRWFGADFIFTYGPWGALFISSYLPGLLGPKIVFELVGRLVLAIVLVDACVPLRPVPRVIFIVSLLLLGPLYPDPLLMFVILVFTFRWLMPVETSPARVAVGVTALAVAGLAKFTLLVLAAAGVACAAVLTVAAGRMRRAALLVSGWIAALLIGWLIAGQRLGDIPEYIRLSRELSEGYAGAMSIDETWRRFALGVALIVVHAAWLFWYLRRAGVRLETLVTAAGLSAGVAMAWKLGFTRADLHVIAFFSFSIWLVAAAPVLTRRAVPLAFIVMATCLSTVGVVRALGDVATDLPAASWRRVSNSLARLKVIAGEQARFEHGFATAAAPYQLPNVRAAVGDRSIDYLGNNQALIFLNGLHYRPRPVPQSYLTYTRALATKNADFIQSGDRPDYLLASFLPIDGRFVAQDDARVLAELPRRYEPVLTENGQLLLKARAQQPPAGPLAVTTIVERPVLLGERVTLPPERTHALWLQVDVHPSLRGSLRSLLYKPAGLTLTTFGEGHGHGTFRLVPGIARDGFIVQPPVYEGVDVEAIVNGEVSRWLDAFTIDVAPGGQAYWEGPLQVRLSRLEALPLRAKSPFAVLVEKGVSNVQPEAVTSSVEWRLMTEPEPMLYLHAAGAATFQAPEGQRHFAGRFGIVDGAYLNGNETDGVVFTMGVAKAGGAETIVFTRTLQPLTKPGDRGPQTFAIDLPADPGLRVTVHTGFGAAGNGQWDWSYVSALRFTARP